MCHYFLHISITPIPRFSIELRFTILRGVGFILSIKNNSVPIFHTIRMTLVINNVANSLGT